MGFDDINEMRFVNFTASEVDSIALEIFQANSNFTSRIDSHFTNAHGRDASDTELILFIPEHINVNHDYKITLNSTGQVYKVTGFSTRKEECNCPTDKYNELDVYYVNGIEKHSDNNVIMLTK